MKHYKLFNRVAVFVLAMLSVVWSCDETEYIADDIRNSISEPQISNFSPTSGGAGTQVMIEGNHLATVNKAYIGGVETTIKNRISNTQILIELTGMEVSGNVKLENNKGEAVSSQSFTIVPVVPSIISILPDVTELNPRDVIEISGTNFKSVKGFFVGDVAAEILFRSNNLAKIVVPFVTADEARIRLQYLAGGGFQYIESTQLYTMLKPVIEPTITSCPDEVEHGNSIFITGEYLDRVNNVFFGELELNITSQSFSQLQIYIPDTFTETVEDQLILIHNGDNQLVVKENFKVIVPGTLEHLFYPDVVISAHEGNSSFFDAETGSVYSNCDAPANRLNIEFCGYITNAMYFTIYGPHNIGSIVNNYKCGADGLGALMGTISELNTTRFRVLQESDPIQNALIQKVKNGELVVINEALFEGIALPSSNTISYRNDPNPTYLNLGTVVWFRNETTNKSGFLVVKAINVNWVTLDKSSTMTFDVYFQK